MVEEMGELRRIRGATVEKVVGEVDGFREIWVTLHGTLWYTLSAMADEVKQEENVEKIGEATNVPRVGQEIEQPIRTEVPTPTEGTPIEPPSITYGAEVPPRTEQ